MTECYFANYTIGEDAYENIENVCKDFGRNVLIVGGETALSKSIEKLRKNLENFNIVDTVIYGKECYKERIEELFNTYKDKRIDFVMGVGGGKALDTSKCLADMLSVPVVTVPTIASTCAASSALAVVYNKDHAFQGFWRFKSPARHTFIDTKIIAEAPYMYLRAGIGDTLAKYYEVEFSARNAEKTFKDNLGIEISKMCSTPLLSIAKEATLSAKEHKATKELEEASLIILVSTGMVSMLINPVFNGALAHALFYGLTEIKGFEEKFLHGDVIGYTTIVQLTLDKNYDEAKRIRRIISQMGVETTLGERNIDTSYENLEKVLDSALLDPDMEVVPYEITKQMLYDAIIEVEEMSGEEEI